MSQSHETGGYRAPSNKDLLIILVEFTSRKTQPDRGVPQKRFTPSAVVIQHGGLQRVVADNINRMASK